MPHCSMNVKRFCALQQEAVRQEPRPGSRDQDRRGPGALWPRWLERERVSNRENSVRPDGAVYQWRKVPPSELSVALVADERFGGATHRAEASCQRSPRAIEQSDRP